MRMSFPMRCLALMLLGLAAGGLGVSPAAAQEKVGVNAAVNTNANGLDRKSVV